MPAIMPVLANGGTYIQVKAHDVLSMAHAAIADIDNRRQVAVREALKECMDEECVHHIPLLGIPIFRHKRYPSTESAMRFAPEVHHAKYIGWGDLATCEHLKSLATWLIHDSGYPAEQQVINLSLNDFCALK